MKDLLFDQERSNALLVICDYCGRPIGQLCVNFHTGEELVNQTAHRVRITAGQRFATTTTGATHEG